MVPTFSEMLSDSGRKTLGLKVAWLAERKCSALSESQAILTCMKPNDENHQAFSKTVASMVQFQVSQQN